MAAIRKTVLISTAIAFASLIGAYYLQKEKGSSYIVFQNNRFPTLGYANAKIEIVLFEDFRCSACQYFEQEIFPQIVSKYIKTGKVKFIVVPLAFLKNSEIVANAAWAVFEQNPNQFFPFAAEIFRYSLKNELNSDDLIKIASQVGGIDLVKLESCIDKDCYFDVLEKNLEWAQDVMGSDFKTPTLYINGAKSSARSFKAIQAQIERFLSP